MFKSLTRQVTNRIARTWDKTNESSTPVQPKRSPSICIRENFKDPMNILRNPHYNKSSAFTYEERQHHRLNGLLPAAVETLELQVERAYQHFCSFDDPLAKHVYLSSLRERNETAFYNLTQNHLKEVMPCIYTPTVGLACQKFGQLFRQSEGLYVDLHDDIDEVLSNWRPGHFQTNETTPNIIVVTDGSRILGLGDLGINGMGIPIGKLALYVAVGGFHPLGVLPITLDVGTNNTKLLEDPLYMGIKEKRPDSETYFKFVDSFMESVHKKWPDCVVQFEDFENKYCFDILEKYSPIYRCFNDDIQGTGVVAAAGFLAALKLAENESGKTWKDQKVVFLGFGSAAAGVANQITTCIVKKYGVTREEVSKIFYMIDSQGLCTRAREGAIADYKAEFTRAADEDIPHNGSLEEVLEKVKPTALIGLSGQTGAFSEEIVKKMADMNKRPIIFSLSNPTSKAECMFADAMKWTDGGVVWAAGSPMEPVNGRESPQGNNLYAFPGIGFGAWLCQASTLTDSMMTAATLAIVNCVTDEMLKDNQLYPPLTEVRDVSDKVASEVMRVALEEGINKAYVPKDATKRLAHVNNQRYVPQYQSWSVPANVSGKKLGNQDSGESLSETLPSSPNVGNASPVKTKK